MNTTLTVKKANPCDCPDFWSRTMDTSSNYNKCFRHHMHHTAWRIHCATTTSVFTTTRIIQHNGYI